MKRSSARRDALSLFLEAPPRRPAQDPAGPAIPGGRESGQAQPPASDDPSIYRPDFRTPGFRTPGFRTPGFRTCSRVLEWFVAESRCLTRLSARPGARRVRELGAEGTPMPLEALDVANVHTTSTRQAAPIRPPRALPLPDAGPGPVPGPGA